MARAACDGTTRLLAPRAGEKHVGLYRLPGNDRLVRQVKEQLDRGEAVDYSAQQLDTISSLVKLWSLSARAAAAVSKADHARTGCGSCRTRCAQPPRIHSCWPHRVRAVHSRVRGSGADGVALCTAAGGSEEEKLEKTKAILDGLPAANRAVLAYLLAHLNRFAASHASHKMTARNLSMVRADNTRMAVPLTTVLPLRRLSLPTWCARAKRRRPRPCRTCRLCATRRWPWR
jgi:hypothetical protein